MLINWTNEIKKFTPGLSFVKVHGSMQERDRILSDPKVAVQIPPHVAHGLVQVLGGEFDLYITTYETVRSATTP